MHSCAKIEEKSLKIETGQSEKAIRFDASQI